MLDVEAEPDISASDVPPSDDPPADSGEAMKNAERGFELLISSLRDAIFLLDVHGRVTTWNPRAQASKGYQAQEIVGRSIEQFYTPEDRATGRPAALLAEARARGRAEDEGWRIRKDGSRFWADVVITALRSPQGELLGYAKVTRDASERREAEQNRIRLAQTEEALRLRDEFLSIAAHELRTPLVALGLQIESLREGQVGLDPKTGKKLERAGRNVRQLADLISSLLDVSRISTGHLTLAPRTTDLSALVAEVLDRLHESGLAAGCEVVAGIEPGIVGSLDPLRLGQVVSNLLANAFKYAAGTRVDVRLTRGDGEAVLAIEDGGPGIPPDQLAYVFGRFTRAASPRHFGGLGLGLYLAQEIVLERRSV